ncbi:MAG: alpha-ketoacid dehydrogenase subunit beta, partial [Flavobacteriales bacterium]
QSDDDLEDGLMEIDSAERPSIVEAQIICSFAGIGEDICWLYRSSVTHLENILTAMAIGIGCSERLELVESSTRTLGQKGYALVKASTAFCDSRKKTNIYESVWVDRTKVVYPSNPYDAKGLLNAAIEDPNPVLFFEHKALYRSVKGDVPSAYYQLEIGKAAVVSSGDSASVVTYGAGVHWATELKERLLLDLEIIDLRTLLPLDTATVFTSVNKTGKALVLHEDSLFGGIGGEIAALINEHCFEYLDAPVKRVGSLDTPVPFSAILEEQYLPIKRFEIAIQELLAY